MNLLNKLTIKNLKLNKKRTIVTIIGIMLSVALLTAVSTMYFSFLQSIINFEKYEKGDFHVMFGDVNKEDYQLMEKNRKVDDIYLTSDIGYAKLDGSKNYYKPYAFINGFTKESLNHLSIKIIEGRMPENDHEILIPTTLKTNGRLEYKVGDKITLEVGKRVINDIELNQNNSLYVDENNLVIESLVDTKEETYEIVGIMERPASNIESYDAPGYTFATLIDKNQIENANVYIKYNKSGMKDYYTATADLLGIDSKMFKLFYTGNFEIYEDYEKILTEISEKIKYLRNVNDYLIILESNPLGDGTMQGLGFVVMIISIIIIVASVFCIKNSFDISIIEKTKQYGMLRSVGATKKQIKRNVLYEAFILGIIGIPLGIFLGLFASVILCMVCNYLLSDLMVGGFNIPCVINYLAIIFAILLGIITIFLSAIKSAFKASHVSPIDSIRNSGNIKIKKQYNTKLINKLFGIGGVISYKNIKRNKKKYRTTIISIIISTTVFIALTYFVTLFYSSVAGDIDNFDYNLNYSVNINNKETLNKVETSVKLDGVINYSLQRSEFIFDLDLKTVDNNEFKGDISAYRDSLLFITLGDHQYKKFLKDNNIEYFDDKVILYDYMTVYNKKNRDTMHVLDYKLGDIIKFSKYEDDEIKEIEIGSIVEKTPFSVNVDSFGSVLVIVSDKLFDELFENSDYYNIFIEASDPDIIQDIIEKEIFENDENIYINNLKEQEAMINKLLLLICIFLYGFVIVVSLIGVTNIFNTITTNMELRKPEFAMLKSIGMTKKEFNRMIRLESLFICTKALVISIIIGSMLSYLIYYKLARGTFIKFTLPIIPILCAVIGVVLLIYILMKFSLNKINKQNTIETIRNENI